MIKPIFTTRLGKLYHGDCLRVLPRIEWESVDMVFADPPFNLGKKYGRSVNDKRSDEEYIAWCHRWIVECAGVLKPGGAMFIYNIPRWNIELGHFLTAQGFLFRHWIAVSIALGMPIRGRLHPSHYSLIYYTKGKPKTFRHIRTPIETCRHCGGDIKDYGGYRAAMNPNGVNLKDVWTDIPPVRHSKFKIEGRLANALSTKIVDRAIEMSTLPGELVLDPFGGSGTTYASCENKKRRWIGIDLESSCDIIERLTSRSVQNHNNRDFVETDDDND